MRSSDTLRIIIILIATAGLLLVIMGLQASLVHAGDRNHIRGVITTPTKTKKPEKPVRTPGATSNFPWIIFPTPVSSRLCGKLVYITGYYPIYDKPIVSTIGLIPCGSGKPLIFATHPRRLVGFYQIRGAKIRIGKTIITKEYGYLNQYITTFKGYIGIESCDACGRSVLPPTWTLAPLTPYTPTPVAPTSTPWLTQLPSTPKPTLAPWEVTRTLEIFEILYGTPTPPQVGKPTAPIALSTPVGSPTSPEPLYRRISPVVLLLLALLAFLIPLVIVLRDYFRDR